ncbi:conjugal transfer protein TraG N-terminal domain-containing protein [Paraburkholderia sp. EG287A]|uniref:conjugal transfer protein TraG N-terminal domain-containing protein n=1 Tax=Paraburkholderia sp. EG287A TaxID=3237012 RepID=UPI0034D1FE84
MRNRTPLARIFGLIAFLLAVAAPEAAMANYVIPAPGMGQGSAWTVYAFGNAQAISDAFQALTNFTNSSVFHSLVGMIAVLGVLFVGGVSGFSSTVAKRFIGYSVATFLVCYVFFGVGNGGPLMVQVEVEDTVDGTWITPISMPAVIGIPASFISTAGYDITQQIESSFPIPDGLKMSNGAPFDLPASMLSDASKAQITDPNLASSMSYYVQDCVIPAIANGNIAASELITSTDFLGTLANANMNSVYVNTLLATGSVGTPDIVSCTDDFNLIQAAFNQTGAASFLKEASAWASTPALNVVNSAADAVAQWSTNSGITDGGAMVKQAAVIATFTGAFKQSAAQTGNSDFLTALSVTQAEQQQISGWVVGAEIFNHTMGYIFAVLQVFTYAIAPMILAVVLIPGLGLALLKNYGQILLWLALCQPMLAIMNFIVISIQQADLGGALASTNGFGFTLSSMGVITEKTANMRAAAMFVGTMTPAIAWAMVKGTVDFSRVIGSGMGESLAAGAANTMTTGNYSLNSASMDTFSANKTSLAATGDFGGYTTANGAMTSRHDFGGSDTPMANGQRFDLSQSAQMGANHGGSLTSNATNQLGGGQGNSAVRSAGSSTSGGTNSAGATTDTSGQAAAVNAGLSGTVPLIPGAAGGGKGGKGGEGGDGTGTLGTQGSGTEPPQTEGTLHKLLSGGAKAARAVAAVPKVSLGSTVAATGAHQTSHTEGAQTQHVGNEGVNGSKSFTGSDNTNTSTGAGTQDGYNQGASMSLSSFSSMADIYRARWLSKQDAPAPVSMDQLGEAARNHTLPGQSSMVAQLAQKASGVAEDYNAEEGAVKKKHAQLDTDAHKRYGAAEKATNADMATAQPLINAGAAGVKADAGVATSDAAQNMMKQVPGMVKNAAEIAHVPQAAAAIQKGIDAMEGKLKALAPTPPTANSLPGMQGSQGAAAPNAAGAPGTSAPASAASAPPASSGYPAAATFVAPSSTPASVSAAPSGYPAGGYPAAAPSVAQTAGGANVAPSAGAPAAAGAPNGPGAGAALSAPSLGQSSTGANAGGGAAAGASAAREASSEPEPAKGAAHGQDTPQAQTTGHALSQSDMLKPQQQANTAGTQTPAAAPNAANGGNGGDVNAGTGSAMQDTNLKPGPNMGLPSIDGMPNF